MAETIKQILIRRDRLTEDEADELIEEVQERINEIVESCNGPSDYVNSLLELEQVIYDNLSLEADYLDEFLY